MLATDARHLQELFHKHFTAGDLDALIDLYEADAVFVGPDGSEAAGKEAVRGALHSLLSLPELSFTYNPYFAAESGDVVLMHASWEITGRDPEGGPVALSGVTVELARRSADGGWRYVVDCPFGTAAVPARA
ncbi:MAG TPA: nuclear transport factor 2 family protein [Arthrobacter sp.]|nr:nuclear transport factor 2 family protein [Arthrobacter sp.]